jgi:hypothetical protein
VETGTFRGDTARTLAQVFPEVMTVELSPQLHAVSSTRLSDLAHVRVIHGNSAEVLRLLATNRVPTFYFLDGHFSGGVTAGEEHECPVLGELRAIGGGNPGNCVVIDDARLFGAAPPPPHDPSHWPTLMEVLDVLRVNWPDHHITVTADQVIAVPARARTVVDRYGRHYESLGASATRLAARILTRAWWTAGSVAQRCSAGGRRHTTST